MSVPTAFFTTRFTKLRLPQTPFTQVIRNFCIYLVGALMIRGASLLLTPLTLTLLSPNDYGVLALINSFASIVTTLLGLGLRQVAALEFFHRTSTERYALINDLIIIYAIVATPSCLFLITVAPWLTHRCFGTAVSTTILIMTIITCFLFFFSELFYQVLRYQGKAKLVTSIQLTSALGALTITLIGLYWLRWGILSIVLSSLVSSTSIVIWALYSYYSTPCKTHLAFTASIKHTRSYLSRGLPFIPTVLCSWVLSSSDRWILAHYAPLAHVGIYALADTGSQLYQLLILQPLSNAYLPYLMEQFSRHRQHVATVEYRNRRYTLMGIGAISSALIIFYCLGRPLLNSLLSPAYQATVQYATVLVVGDIILTATYALSAIIHFHKKTWFMAGALALPALVNTGLNVLFIPHWGIQGCVLATLIAQLAYFMLVLWYNQRLIRRTGDASA